MKPPKKAKQKSTAAKQRLISATSKSGGSLRRSGTNLEGSNMNYETKAADLWEQTKAWADKNRTISGALVGGWDDRAGARDGDRRGLHRKAPFVHTGIFVTSSLAS